MRLITKTDNKIIFGTEIEDSLVNAIRRYVNQVPVLAVDYLEISKNDSALYDETVAHRVGLIPLKAPKGVTEKSPGKLTLEVKKPGMVYSGELKGSPEIVYDKIPITLLDKGQELKFVASVRAGKGEEHAKFSPGTVFYRNATEVTLDKEFYDDVKNICPENEVKEKGDKIVVKDNLYKEVADVCEGLANKKGKKAHVEDTKEMIISVESWGQMNVKDIFMSAVDVLEKDLKEVSKKTK